MKAWAARAKDIMKFSLLVLLAALALMAWAIYTDEHASRNVSEWAAVVEGGKP